MTPYPCGIIYETTSYRSRHRGGATIAFERYEIISPPASAFRHLIEQFRAAPRETRFPHITVVARHIGTVPHDQVEQVTLDVRLLGVLPGENGNRLYGETGSNPASTVDIAVSDAPDFPVVLTMTVPNRPRDV